MLRANPPKRPLLARVSLKTVLVLGAVVAAALPAGVFALRSAWLDERERRAERADDNLVLAQALAVTFDQFLKSQLAAAALLAREAATGPLDQGRLGPILERTLASQPTFETILVVDRSGTSVAFQPLDKAPGGRALGIAFADHEWFGQVSRLRRPLVDQTVLADRVTGTPTVALRAPVLGSTGELRGIVAVSLNLREVAAMARRVTLGTSGYVTVAAADGLILAHPVAPLVARVSLATGPLWSRVGSRDSGHLPPFLDGGVERIGAFATVPAAQWKVVASQSTAELEALSRERIRGSLTWVGLAFVLAVGPMMALAVLIARPIQAVVEAAQRLAAGDLTSRARGAGGLAELDTLVRSFHHMAQALETNQARLREAEVERRTADARVRLASIVESSEDAIITETVDGVISSWNKAAERTYGYAGGEALGQPVSMLIAPGGGQRAHPEPRGPRGAGPPGAGRPRPQGRHPDRRLPHRVAHPGHRRTSHRSVDDRPGRHRSQARRPGAGAGSPGPPRHRRVQRLPPPGARGE